MSTTIDALRDARSLLQREHPEHPVTVRLSNAVDCVETLTHHAREALRIHIPLRDEHGHRIQCELREALRTFGPLR